MFLSGDQPLPTPPRALEDLPTERLEHEIVEIAGRLAATTCRWLLLIAEYDRRDACSGWGFDSCSAWIAWQCSMDQRSAREHVRVARRLGELRLVREGFGRGELSYSKVRAITRIATPENEEELVELARNATAAQLDRVVRDYGRRISAAAAFDAQEARFFEHHWDEDGCLQFSGRLPAELGAVLVRALEAAETFDEGGPAEPSREPRARRADAVVSMADGFLADDNGPRSSGERHQVVVHVDAEVLGEEGDGRCSIEAGPVIAAETARRLSCDSSLVPMLDGPEGPLSVGRKRRTIPPATRRALASRDEGCRFPGCQNRRFVEGHHIRHWAMGGETSLENLVQLCTHHHRLVHEGGFQAHLGRGGEIHFLRRNGGEVKPRPRPRHGQIANPAVTSGGMMPVSRGDYLDHDLTVWGLLARAGPGG